MNNAYSNPTLKWYVVYTYPHYEKKVTNDLSKCNIGYYLPLQKVVKHWSDRKKLVEVPLFPNYVFVNTTRAEHYKVLGVHGVSRFVSIGVSPVIINENEIAVLRHALAPREITENRNKYMLATK